MSECNDLGDAEVFIEMAEETRGESFAAFLFVLAAVGIDGEDEGDLVGARVADGVDRDQKTHDVVIY